MIGVALLAFPVLATLALLYGLSLRKRLINSLNDIERLSRQAMTQEAAKRECEACLADSRASQEKLMREFHHRVKNSLQIIQSYLTLSRRQKPAPHNICLAEVEAKVQVISAAYRLALIDGIMGTIPIRTFVQDIVGNTQTILCGASRRINASIESDDFLVLDRTIPMGLAIAEAITAALGAPGVMHIGVRIRSISAGERILTVAIDDVFANVSLPLRLMAGLCSQLEAGAEPCAAGEILNWRFSTGTPDQPVP